MDKRLSQVIEMLDTLTFDDYRRVLDVGAGKCQISKWLIKKGFSVTATGLEMDSYEVDINSNNCNENIKLVECSVENMPFNDGAFDIVIMSHVLEHCNNVGLALKEIHRVLSKPGVLCIFVPPHDNYVLSGHISVGWNVGQLMYTLLINGFDVKSGKFAEYGYNVAGVVKKSLHKMPSLRGDRGDIHILDQHKLWPLPIRSNDRLNDNFYGHIRSINWDVKRLVLNEKKRRGFFSVVVLILNLLPSTIRFKLATTLFRFSQIVSISLNSSELTSPN